MGEVKRIVKKYGNQYEVVRAATKELGDPSRLVWATMVYGCSGNMRDIKFEGGKITEPKGCGYEEVREVGIGVEGPPQLREVGKYVPTPYYAGGCPKCNGTMRHIDWNRDEEFEPRERDNSRPAFMLPGKRKAREFDASGYGGAELFAAKEPDHE